MVPAYSRIVDFLFAVSKNVDKTLAMRTKNNNNSRKDGPQKCGLPHPKAARNAKGISGETLAQLIDCSPTTVWNCERSGQYPAQRALRKAYMKALGVQP